MAFGVDGMMKLQGKIYGDKEVRRMLAIAPKAFLKTARHWFYSERKRYVGNDKKKGLFRRQMQSLKLGAGAVSPFKRSGKWPQNVINAFKGYVYGANSLGNITLKMGAGIQNPSKFMQGLAMMDMKYSGSREISSGEPMTLPVYENLRKRGISIQYLAKMRPRNQAFRKIMQDDQIFTRRLPDGTVLYFDEMDRYKTGSKRGQMKRSALLFIGKRKVKLKPKFDFKGQWERGIPAVVSRGQTLIDRTTRALTLGYLKAE